MSENIAALLYLVASICFIMALRGLSSPETSRAGNIYGIAGMVIAVATTLATRESSRVARPGMAFCSWSTTGTRAAAAARTTGALT